jgi:lipopolysaccharide transport system ATP-binding protein
MSEPVIKIQNLGKRYRYGGVAPVSDSLRTDLTDWAKGLLRLQKEKRPPGTHHESFRQVQAHRLDVDPNYFWALRDVNLEIKQGEIVGVIGRNGSGKSTLLKILSRITPPTSGTITYHGRVASLLEVGTGFHRELTGRENVFLNGSILGMKRAEITRRFDEIVAFAEVDKFIDTPVKFYSSGMYVRLAFAVAAHLEPEILIVDEVLAVGDAAFQKKCLGKIGEVASLGRTVLFVSHNMGAVIQLCSRAVLLQDGRVTSEAGVKEVVEHYLEASSARAVDLDLATMSERAGDGRLRFTKAYLNNAGGQRVRTPISGDPTDIVLEFQARQDLSYVRFMLTIYNHTGLAITHCSVDAHGHRFHLPQGDGQIICQIPKLPLPCDRYRVSIAAYDDKRLLDRISEACVFEVESGNFFPTSYMPLAENSMTLVEHSWTLTPNRALSRAQ